MKKIVVLISITLIVFICILYRINQKKYYDFDNERIKNDEKIAKVIVNIFESTYNKLYIKNNGVEPTLTEIEKNYNMEGLDEGYPRIEKGVLKVKSKNEDVECVTEKVSPNIKKSISLRCKIRGISYNDKIFSKYFIVNGIGEIE